MPPHIYYIYPESGEIQEGLNDPQPAPMSCEGGILTMQTTDAVGTACQYSFRYKSTSTGSPLVEAAPSKCTLQLTNLKWAAPIPSRMTDRKRIYAVWAGSDVAIRYTAIVVGVAKDGGVRALADEMKTEHGDLNNHLAQVFAAMKTNWAQSPAPAGVASDVSNAINSAGEAKRRNMLRLGAGNNLAQVDRQFVLDEYRFHNKMVKTIQGFIATTKDEQLKTFLNEALETFNRHIMHAEMLSAAIGIKPTELAAIKNAPPFPAP
jgi:predicted outer membrane protein